MTAQNQYYCLEARYDDMSAIFLEGNGTMSLEKAVNAFKILGHLCSVKDIATGKTVYTQPGSCAEQARKIETEMINRGHGSNAKEAVLHNRGAN